MEDHLLELSQMNIEPVYVWQPKRRPWYWVFTFWREKWRHWGEHIQTNPNVPVFNPRETAGEWSWNEKPKIDDDDDLL